MDKVYQVFVSSTYSDLREERQQVSDTLAKAGLVPAGMELFPATDEQQLEFIKRAIDRSDYYVVIVAGRYGSIADGEVSYTEKEYEYAVFRKIPVLAFIHECPKQLEVAKVDIDPAQSARLEAFRQRLKSSRIVSFWISRHDLCTKVLTAVTQAINLSPGVGWVRGDQAVDPRVLLETERLRIENADLKQKLDQLESGVIQFPPDIAGPNDEIEFTVAAVFKDKATKESMRKEIRKAIRIGKLFVELFDELLLNPSEERITRAIASILLGYRHRLDTLTGVTVSEQQVVRFRFHLEALGLIQAEADNKASSVDYILRGRTNVLWTLTQKGRRYVARELAIPRGETISA